MTVKSARGGVGVVASADPTGGDAAGVIANVVVCVGVGKAAAPSWDPGCSHICPGKSNSGLIY